MSGQVQPQESPRPDPPFYQHPARILTAAGERTAAGTLLDIARTKASDPAAFGDTSPFFFAGEISNNQIDSYFTKMMPSTLQNFAAKADEGVALQHSHVTRNLGLGRSLTGKYSGPQGNGKARAVADFMIVPGLQLNPDITNDDAIRAIQTGSVSDLSVGFFGGSQRCSICGGDMLGWWRDGGCAQHFEGMDYPVLDKKGNPTGETVTAIGQIEDAQLAEVSLVFSGATPGASVIRAQQMADAGMLQPDAARMLEARYRIHLPGSERRHPGVDAPKPAPKEAPVDDPTRAPGSAVDDAQTPDAETRLAQVTAHLESARSAFDQVRSLAGEPEGVTAEVVLEKVRTLVAQAADGRAYRADLVEETLREGVRANGPTFAADDYRALLEGASLARIKTVRDGFANVAAQLFKGGRTTVDTVEKPAGSNAHNGVSDASFVA